MKFLKVYVEITNACNLQCSFCSKTNREIKYMSVTEFEKVAKEVSEYTSLIALHIKGEPLLHKNLKEILEISKQNNLKVNITTNATLLDKQLDVLLNSDSLRQINLSLHSAEQNGIEQEKYLNKIFECVDKIHLNTDVIISYRLWNLKNIWVNEVNSKILNMIGEKYKVSNIVEKAKENEFIELDKNIFLNQDTEFEWPDMNKEIISKTGKCYGLRNQLGILSNGDVVPCCLDGNADILLGNVFENSLKNIIESAKSKSIIEGFERHELVEELCQKCGFIQSRFNK